MVGANGKPETLQAAREAANLSRRELAERCRVTTAAVGHWETGAHAPLGPSRLALAAALGVDPETVDGWFQGSAERAA
jgi:DNA-binding transcriptional regulator YiaG